jgi:hypothetical protein
MRFYILLFAIFINFQLPAQQSQNSFELIVIGHGISKNDAHLEAFHSAVAQGVNIYMENPKGINLKSIKYTNNDFILSEIVMNDTCIVGNKHISYLKFTFSLEKFYSFFESNGFKRNEAGGIYSIKIMNDKLLISSEVVALKNCLNLIDSLKNNIYDFDFTHKSPTTKFDPMFYIIDFRIRSTPNENIKVVYNTLKEFLKIYTLNSKDVEDAKIANRPFYKLTFERANYYFRSEPAVNLLKQIFVEIISKRDKYALYDGTRGWNHNWEKLGNLDYHNSTYHYSINTNDLREVKIGEHFIFEDMSPAYSLTDLEKVRDFSVFRRDVAINTYKVNFDGNKFASKIRSQKAMEEDEVLKIWEALFKLNPVLNKSFSYKLNVNDPVELNGGSSYKVVFNVDCYTNYNIDTVCMGLKNILNSLSLDSSELAYHDDLKNRYFEIKIDDKSYYLRNIKSALAVKYFFDEIKYIERRFIIDDGLEKMLGSSFIQFYPIDNSDLNLISVPLDDNYIEFFNFSGFENRKDWEFYESNNQGGIESIRFINYKVNSDLVGSYIFRSVNDTIKKFNIEKRYKLDDITKINKFKIYSNSTINNIGIWKNGGIVFHEATNFEFIMPINYGTQMQKLEFNNKYLNAFSKLNTDTIIGSGLNNCNSLNKFSKNYSSPFIFSKMIDLNNFTDWFIPSKNEMQQLFLFHRKYFSPSYILGDLNSDFLTSSIYKNNNFQNEGFYTFVQEIDNQSIQEILSIYNFPKEKKVISQIGKPPSNSMKDTTPKTFNFKMNFIPIRMHINYY